MLGGLFCEVFEKEGLLGFGLQHCLAPAIRRALDATTRLLHLGLTVAVGACIMAYCGDIE